MGQLNPVTGEAPALIPALMGALSRATTRIHGTVSNPQGTALARLV
jgi:hypothetical protein